MIKKLVFSIIFCFILLEILLRIFGQNIVPEFYEHRGPKEFQFWQKDSYLGWSRIPNSSGVFTNESFKGDVNNDNRGNRKNSRNGTYVPGYKNIFFIGDSATASLEVNDKFTVPAQLEQALRVAGLDINILNFGVRGYGTDQSVRKAIKLADEYMPEEIIYMFVGNDMFENNTIRKALRKYGKGVYIKNEDSSEFTEHNYPVADFNDNYVGLVIFDEKCQPKIHEATMPPQSISYFNEDNIYARIYELLNMKLYSYRTLKHTLNKLFDLITNTDDESDNLLNTNGNLYNIINKYGVKWDSRFEISYWEGGYYRTNCSNYLEDQMSFLINKLWQTDSVKKVHIIQFPNSYNISKVKTNKTTINHIFFSNLIKEGVISSYLDLNIEIVKDSMNMKDFECPGDPHFCEKGNEWISNHIFESIYSNQK